MTHEIARRAVLKGSALIAAPVAAVAAPAVAFAADDSAGRLARLENQRAIEALHGRLLRKLAASGPTGARDLLPNDCANRLGADLGRIVAEGHNEPELEMADDGRSASLRCHCQVERLVHHTGNSTIEKMARMQGNVAARSIESRLLRSRFTRTPEGWTITAAELV